jgi:hypothetical protein
VGAEGETQRGPPPQQAQRHSHRRAHGVPPAPRRGMPTRSPPGTSSGASPGRP